MHGRLLFPALDCVAGIHIQAVMQRTCGLVFESLSATLRMQNLTHMGQGQNAEANLLWKGCRLLAVVRAARLALQHLQRQRARARARQRRMRLREHAQDRQRAWDSAWDTKAYAATQCSSSLMLNCHCSWYIEDCHL